MRILHVVEASFAGVGRHVLDLAGEQARRGHEVAVAYSPIRESDSFRAERRALDSVRWHEVPMGRGPGPSDVASGRAIRRLMTATEPDVVHGHSTKGGLLARCVPGPRRRTVYTPNAVFSMNPSLSGRKRAIIARIEQLLSHVTDVVIAVSPEERGHLRSIGVAAERIHLVPNGIHPVARADGAEVRAALSLPAEAPLVGFVGRLDDQKAPDDLLRIFAAVADRAPGPHFVVVGSGPRADLVTRAAYEDDRLVGRLHVLGEQPGTWAMSALDVMLLPSRYEGFPYVLIEAAHLGLPIVTTRQSCASVLESGPADVRVADAGDIDRLSELVVAALDRPDRVGSRCDRRFTVESMAGGVELAYRGEAVDSVVTGGA